MPNVATPLTRLLALAALAGAILVVLVLVLTNGGGSPSTREQYGGHGGRPGVATGAVGRVALDGRWRYAADPRDAGGRLRWHEGRFAGRAVELPYVPNARQTTGVAGERSFEGSVGWYRTTLRVPRTGRYAIRFESVNHRADVWVDGQHVATHQGTYLPFEVRRTLDESRPHTVVVRADWRDPDAMKATGWHRAWFNFGGINREVTIRPLGDTEVPSAAIRTTVEDGDIALVEVKARARNLAGTREIDLRGTLRRGDQEIELDFPATRVPGSASREVRATAEVRDAALWAPGSPNLYDLDIRAGDDVLWHGRVGLRELRREGRRLLLNDQELRLRGASLHEDVPGRGDGLRPADERRLVSELRRLGANATRAQHPLNPGLLEKLDAAGLLVWLGVGPVDAPGSWTSKGPKLAQQARARVRTSLAQLQTHPSILAWNLANEVAGQGHPDGQPEYIDAMAAELRRRDPGRLVALDVWGSHPPKYAGPMYRNIDAIGWTNYIGWYEEPFASREGIEELIRTKLASLQQVFPDKVIAVTEFGAEATPRNPPDRPGGLRFQADLLRTHVETYAAMPGLSGMLVWNLRDFAVAPSFNGGSIKEVVPEISILPGRNEKGLFTYDGRPKPSLHVVRRLYAALA